MQISLHLPPRPERDIPIEIGRGALERIAAEKIAQYESVVIAFDEGVTQFATHVERVISLHAQKVHRIPVLSGDGTKTLDTLGQIAVEMLRFGANRRTLLLNVGGGVVTDIGGMLGSTYMRGIDFWHIPTSLLAMVDAAVGGKTGVNVGRVKNILGTFTHPKAIIADTAALATLPDAQLSEGLVEVVKMAAMLDAEHFRWIEEYIPRILAREDAVLEECIGRAVGMKVMIVAADEREGGKRKYLNFGHTIGHALETVSGFRISHGEAVSRGMAWEMRLAKTEDAEQITHLLKAIDMPADSAGPEDLREMWQVMQNDKKTESGLVSIAAPEKIGVGKLLTITEEQFLSSRP